MFDTLFSDVVTLVEKWKPKNLTSEAKYRDDLLDYLRKNLNKEDDLWGSSKKVSIRKESGRHLADIGIDNKVGVELKYNLNCARASLLN